MQHAIMPSEQLVTIDYRDFAFTQAFRILKPVVYQQNDQYHCLYGPDTRPGIGGVENTLQQALDEWETLLCKRIMYRVNYL